MQLPKGLQLIETTETILQIRKEATFLEVVNEATV